MFLSKYFKPFLWLFCFYTGVCVIVRMALLLNPVTATHFNFIDYIKIFVAGTVTDALIFVVLFALFWLYFLFISDIKFKRPFGYIIFGLLITLLCYLVFFNNILKQYGNVVPLIGISFIAFKTFLFGLMLFIPKLRKPIRAIFYFLTLFLFVALILLNALSEYYFWNEFGVRYNFIAVDYLIYTNEVIGNIMESYPVLPIFILIGIAALIITRLIFRSTKNCIVQLPAFFTKIKIAFMYCIAVFI